MYADRYAKRRQVNPGSIILALAVNGVILGGLVLFANPTFKKSIDVIMAIDPIPLDPVKPPPPPPPPTHEKIIPEAPAQPVDTSKPVTTTKVADPTPIDPVPFTPPLDGGGSVGVGTVITPVKPLPPVLTDPVIDSRYAAQFQPVFPPDEQRAGRGGRVVVRVLVGVDGRVKDIEPVSATSDSFFAVTRKRALEKWRFKPGTRGGIPVEAWRVVAVSFVLNDAD